MSTPHEITINVVSAASLSPNDEAELRAAFEGSGGSAVLKALALAWKSENPGERLALNMPEGKGVVSESLKFRELEFFKELIGAAMQVDGDSKIVVRLEDDSLTLNRVTELYAVLAYLGSLVGGWESDSEFSWSHPGVGKSSFYWEGDGLVFPEGDFN